MFSKCLQDFILFVQQRCWAFLLIVLVFLAGRLSTTNKKMGLLVDNLPFFVAQTTSKAYVEVNNTRSYNSSLDSILESCGEICHTNISGTPGKFFEALVKKVDCMAILTNPALDASMLEKEPPSQIPPHLLNAYTYDGKVAVRYVATWNQRYLGAQVGC
jgi:hypothetical protein